jgi:hypothetical protein
MGTIYWFIRLFAGLPPLDGLVATTDGWRISVILMFYAFSLST